MRWLIASMVVLCLPSSARADARDGADQQYEDGIVAYRIQDWDAAIVHFREAYVIGRDPDMLYNIGASYQKKGDPVQAITFYKSYLKARPDAPDGAKVRARIVEMEREVATRAAAAREAPPPPPPPQAPPPLVQPPPAPVVEQRPSRSLQIAGLTAAGAGVALIATGIVFALGASSAQQEVDDARAAHAPWSDTLAAADERGRSYALWSKITLIGGGTALVAGGVLLALAPRARHAVHVSPTVAAGFAGVSIAGSF